MSERRIKAVIDLTAAKHNIKSLYNHMDKPVPIMCVIKANGYGHGAVALAKTYEEMNEVCGYAVATAEEAMELRNSGINKLILILGATFEEDYELLIDNDISLTVFDEKSALGMSLAAKNLNKTAKVHIKVDTGMSRIGITPDNDGLSVIKNISNMDNINIEGMFTHFARADEIDKQYAVRQLERYNNIEKMVEHEGINIKIKHCSNSAALLEMPEARFDMVRAGIVLYGLWPSDEVIKENVDIKPVMSLVSHVSFVKTISMGTQISYGGTYVADKEMKIATVPVGYADGYPRLLSNKGKVIINGCYAPIVGRVCMDQFMVDVSDIDSVEAGSKVILLGTDGECSITAEDIGDISGRFNYELVCDITQRVPRIYNS